MIRVKEKGKEFDLGKHLEPMPLRVTFKTNEEGMRKLKRLRQAEDRTASALIRVLIDRAYDELEKSRKA